MKQKPYITCRRDELMLGLDSSAQIRFARTFAEYAAAGLKDAVVIHDDALVADWHLEGQDRVNFVFSCTKSFLSALVGIALDRGLFPGIDRPIAETFPELPGLNPDPRFQAITPRYLLSMTSGIDGPPLGRGKGAYDRMVRSEDWVAFVLQQPMAWEPGTHFNYSDTCSHLLSAMLSRATGMSALAFAERHLFTQLGIANARWKANRGVNLGGTGLHVRTIDMAMLGHLYLNNGSIGDKQVISKAWVRESTRIHAEGHPEWFGGYGFHWWVSPQAHNHHEDLFFALGQHGQYIFVAPARRLVAAFRKKPGRKEGVMLPQAIFFDHVLPCFGG